MIEKDDIGDGFYVSCDFCSYQEQIDGLFHNIVASIKSNGWKILKKDGDWVNKCPSCAE